MRIGDRCFVHGYIDEIRKDTVIIRNNGGYFGTDPGDVIAVCDTGHPNWIFCSKRLPDRDEDGYSDKVLVCFDHTSHVEICEYREGDDGGKWYIGDMEDSPEDVGLEVIAWMPLPDPYKERWEK